MLYIEPLCPLRANLHSQQKTLPCTPPRMHIFGYLLTLLRAYQLVAHPYLLVQATSERFLPALVATNGSR